MERWEPQSLVEEEPGLPSKSKRSYSSILFREEGRQCLVLLLYHEKSIVQKLRARNICCRSSYLLNKYGANAD